LRPRRSGLLPRSASDRGNGIRPNLRVRGDRSGYSQNVSKAGIARRQQMIASQITLRKRRFSEIGCVYASSMANG
jgi:hypothetical protein